MTVKIPVSTKYDGQGFSQLQKDAKEQQRQATRMRKLQERHARATLQETRQRIAERRRLLTASKRLERQLEQERKAAEKATKAASRERGPGLKGQIGAAVGGQLAGAMAVETLASGLGNFAKQSLAAGDQAIATARTFENLSGNSELAAKNLEAMGRATRGLVSEQQQQQIANQLLGMNIATTSQELEKVVNVSRRLGKEFKGMNAKEAADDFALMISNMSVARLDSFGLSSGAVRKRIDELMESTEGMTREQAFFQASMEEADKTLARLGPEIGTNADKMAELQARYADFQASVGELLLKLGDAGIVDGLINIVEKLEAGADAWSGFIDNAQMLADVLPSVNLSLTPTTEEIARFTQSLANAINPLVVLGTGISSFYQSLANGEGFIASWQSALEDQGHIFGDLLTDTIKLVTDEEELGQAMAEAAASTEQQTRAMLENVVASEEVAEATEEVSQKVRDAARKMIDINERAAADSQQAYDDYFDNVSEAGRDSFDRLNKLAEDSAKERLKIQKDLAKDLEKLGKDLAKDLAKLEKDSGKRVNRAEQDFARDRKQKEKLRQIDALADERLFQFGLRQLEAEGQGNAIAAALERREIEQQIAAEKAETERQIEDENHAVEIDRMKEDARARAEELRAEAEERKRLLEEQAAEAEERRKQELKEAEDAERESFNQRRDELGKFLDEKLAEIDKGKNDAIAALARELAEIGDLTESELNQLVDAAGRFGRDAGEAFAEGLRRGAETLSNLDSLVPTSPGGGGGRLSGGGGGSRHAPGRGPVAFQHGGSFVVGGNGPADSTLVQFWASPGEEVNVKTPAQQKAGMPSINISAQGVDAQALTAILQGKVEEGLEIYHEQVIKPWAKGM